MPSFKKLSVQRVSTSEQIADGITEMIVGGELEAGEALRESALAKELGVSRNTIRETVRILEHGGLVIHEMHRGAVVRVPSVLEIRELYRVRLLLERSVVNFAELPDRLEKMRDALEELESAAKEGISSEIIKCDLQFHRALVDVTESPRLDSFFHDLANSQRFYLTVLAAKGREYEHPEETVNEHLEILEALESGDRELADQLLEQHITQASDRVASLLEDPPEPVAVLE